MNAEEYLLGHWLRKRVWKRIDAPVHQNRLRWCADAVRGGVTFADIGCGLGHSTASLKRFIRGVWTGIDLSEPVIAQARALFPDIEFLAAIPEDRQWDGVVCSEVIEHVDDDAAWARRLWAVTGRKLVVTTPATEVDDPGHLRLYTEPMLRNVFRFIDNVKIYQKGRFWFVAGERE